MDFLDSSRAVAAGAGEDDGNGIAAGVPGQGGEEEVDGQLRLPIGFSVGQVETPAGDGHMGLGGDQVDGIRFQGNAVGDPVDGHGGMAGQQVVHQAFEIGGEVLDDDEGRAAVGRHVVEEVLEGGKPAGRGADGDDGGRVARRGFRLGAAGHPGALRTT